jgi:c-di-GMP-binding flagellar brake protein YcgR
VFEGAWRVNSTKRKYKRHKTTTPATVRSGEHTLAATTRDVSLGGLFIFTDAALREGSEIEVVLMLPKELGLPDSQMVCCHGKIVRSEMVDGQHGVAATIERFQSLPQA